METKHEPKYELIKDYCNFSPIDKTEQGSTEPFFSRFPCDSCGSELAGNRYLCFAKHMPTKQTAEFQICEDCYGYFFS